MCFAMFNRDVVVVGGRVVSNGREKSVDSRDERCLICAINRLQI